MQKNDPKFRKKLLLKFFYSILLIYGEKIFFPFFGKKNGRIFFESTVKKVKNTKFLGLEYRAKTKNFIKMCHTLEKKIQKTKKKSKNVQKVTKKCVILGGKKNRRFLGKLFSEKKKSKVPILGQKEKFEK